MVDILHLAEKLKTYELENLLDIPKETLEDILYYTGPADWLAMEMQQWPAILSAVDGSFWNLFYIWQDTRKQHIYPVIFTTIIYSEC